MTDETPEEKVKNAIVWLKRALQGLKDERVRKLINEALFYLEDV